MTFASVYLRESQVPQPFLVYSTFEICLELEVLRAGWLFLEDILVRDDASATNCRFYW